MIFFKQFHCFFILQVSKEIFGSFQFFIGSMITFYCCYRIDHITGQGIRQLLDNIQLIFISERIRIINRSDLICSFSNFGCNGSYVCTVIYFQATQCL